MKIIGIGVDIIENRRIKSSIKNKKFVSRIFSKNEILDLKKKSNKTNYLSKRFAAKEALAKAIGTGFRDGLNFKDIEVVNNKHGKPYYIISSKIKNFIKKKEKLKASICFFQFQTKKNIQ